MKKNYTFYSLSVFFICLAGFALVKYTPFFDRLFPQDSLSRQVTEPILGIYNDSGLISVNEATSIEHYLIKWKSPDATVPKLFSGLPDGRDILLTVELWEDAISSDSYYGVLNKLVKGEYDDKILHFCTTLAERQQKVYLRWNPEMEVPVNLYPWQNQSPILFREAFTHFTNLCRSVAPNIKMVWGPAGFPGAMEYWPGADVVDFASITLGSPSELLPTKYTPEKSIPQMIRRKLHRLRLIDIPVFLLGSEKINQQTYSREWLETISRNLEPYRMKINPANRQTINASDLTAAGGSAMAPENAETASVPQIGLYDPNQQLTSQQTVTTEHLFTDFPELRNGNFRKKFNEAIARNHGVIVTMEPWFGAGNERDPDVLTKTINGNYNDEIEELYKIISDTDQIVYLRWAHEMEIPTERYDWQSQDPILYIQSYRYFANFMESRSANIRMVWGPAGDRGSLEWWPGDDVVDYISIAIYGLPDENITNHEQQETFTTIFKRKVYRMRFVNKPIFITEFGVKGPDNFQKAWLKEAAQTINKYPEVVGVCYFNKTDVPEAWGKIEAPDWSISEDTFREFTEALATRR